MVSSGACKIAAHAIALIATQMA
eukprot:COSAG05_NODE_14978_length_381_cov_1.443262_1_plen_22_part_10